MRSASSTLQVPETGRPCLGVIGLLLLLAALASVHSAADATRTPTPHGVTQDTVQRVHGTLRDINASNSSTAEKREQLQRVMQEHPYIFRNANIDPLNEQALDAAILHVETLLYEVAVEDAPTPESKLLVIGNAPAEVRLSLEAEGPPLIAPLDHGDEIIFTKEKSAIGRATGQAKPAPQPIAAKKPANTQQPAVKIASDPRPPGHPARSLTAQASDLWVARY